jgi:hypothetical protein
VIGLEGPEVEFVIVVFDSQICELQCVAKPLREEGRRRRRKRKR